MPSVTIRNVPENVLDGLRKLSLSERRSLNSQILVILEEALRMEPKVKACAISVDAQIDLWSRLADDWEDTRPAEEIAADIVSNRTYGRKVTL